MFFEPLVGVTTMREVIAMVGGPSDFVEIEEVDPAILRKAYDLVDATIEVDGNDVVFNLVDPYPPFINILAKGGSWSSILSKDWMVANGAWDGNPDTWSKWYDQSLEQMVLYDKANGTGPFKLDIWDKSGSQILLSRFDEYWRGPAALKNVVIKDIPEFSTRLLMLRAGDADAIYVGDPDLPQVRTIPGVTVVDGLPQVTNTVLFFSFTIPVGGNEDLVGSGKLDGNGIPSDFFADVNVRKAFSYAFDYQAYLSEVALGNGEIPKGPFPQSLPYVNTEQEYYSHDLAKATEYFKKAFDGEVWEKGFKVGIVYNTGNDARKTALEILEYNIERINPKFQVEVIGLEWSTVLDRLRSASLPIFVMGWMMDFPDTHNFAVPFMHSTGTFAGFCGQGLIDLAKEEFDELIAAGIKATDPAEREKIYHELQRLYVDLAIGMPYMEATTNRVMRDWVQGFEYCPAYSGGNVLQVKQEEYVMAARAGGVRHWKILTRHILPNTIFPVLIQASMNMGSIVVTASTLSFLGLGAPEGHADWGQMISFARNWILGTPDNPLAYWYTVLWPGLAIVLFVLSWNLIGDAFRDIMDPRIQG